MGLENVKGVVTEVLEVIFVVLSMMVKAIALPIKVLGRMVGLEAFESYLTVLALIVLAVMVSVLISGFTTNILNEISQQTTSFIQ